MPRRRVRCKEFEHVAYAMRTLLSASPNPSWCVCLCRIVCVFGYLCVFRDKCLCAGCAFAFHLPLPLFVCPVVAACHIAAKIEIIAAVAASSETL